LILNKKLLLASTSRYRRELLNRLQIPFETISPQVDETRLENESCRDLALRLAIAKARAGAALSGWTEGVVIGSDQVADLDNVALGKPGTRERAREQLLAMRGKQVIFHTALCVHEINGDELCAVVPTQVTLRNYSGRAIEAYLDREDALDCAGSAKSEGLGVALIERMTSDDPTALIGLPLIALVGMLSQAGIVVLDRE
jgi:septum formation protein